ncbi:endolytic transglycosylase MltG [Candidatus Nomurabacteria bacterium]|nr:endolytic transglycosylase MltG [Candidatus Nomurabacteria bacterium]
MKNKNIFYTLSVIVFLIFFYSFFLSAPSDFTPKTVISIESGMSLHGVSALLKNEHIVRSRVVFEFFMIAMRGEKHIISTNYFFENKIPVWQVAYRITNGEHHMAPVALTIPEGFNIEQIADASAPKLANFSKMKFLLETKDLEGYLFPDTYFFLTNTTDKDVVKSMTDNFNKKIYPLLPVIVQSGKSEKDIITMASVIEREAKGDTDRSVIAGILWKRISIGMPLQVDAASETYKTKGLPKNPIGNPGLLAIESAISPQNSPYLYYLHDKNGNIHYAKTFAEHNQNIKKYLLGK